MIGEIQYQLLDKMITATLGDDQMWHCPDDPITEIYLDLNFPVRDEYSPADGDPGYQQLHDAAKFLTTRFDNVTLSFEDKEDTDALLY